MNYFKELFVGNMNEGKIRYTELDQHTIKVVFDGDNLKTINIYVFFDKDGDPLVQFKCWDILSFKGHEELGYRACNEVNNRWRWTKFYLDRDSDLNACIDAYIDARSGGRECVNMLGRIASIIDETYPTFTKALWG